MAIKSAKQALQAVEETKVALAELLSEKSAKCLKADKTLNVIEEISNFLKELLVNEEPAECLKKLSTSPDWPSAVPDVYICSDSEDDKFARAEAILYYLIVGSIKDKNVLDFGCGFGHLAVKAAELGAKAVGYDLETSSSFEWENDSKCLLTTDFNRIKSLSPFDIIILYDVLDHAENPIEILHQIRELCHSHTEVLIRCHPFMARHGGHLYKSINKAFAHLVFTNEELASMGHAIDGCLQRLDQPIVSYHQWFNDSKFKVIREDILTDETDHFFKNNSLVYSRMPKQTSVVGSWKHHVNGITQVITIYPNGKFKNISGCENWEIDGLRLILRWPVAGGVWVDTLLLNSAMTRYEGKNQQGMFIAGDRIDVKEQSFIDFVLKPC